MSDELTAAPQHPAIGSLPTYNVNPYTPDRGITAPGVVMLISALVLIGAGLGFVAHFISQYFYLILLFPAAIGFVLGLVGAAMVKKGRIRNPLIGGLAGFLGGVFAMLMMHYFDYETFRADMAVYEQEAPEFFRDVRADNASWKKPDEFKETQEEYDRFIEAMRVQSFPAFMELQAHRGVELKKAASSSSTSGLNLGYYGSYIYWIVEVLIVSVITYMMVRAQAAQPYCRDCDDWRDTLAIGAVESPALAKQGIETGDLNKLAEARPNEGSVLLTAHHCKSCQGNPPTIALDGAVVSYDKNGKKQETLIARATWPQEALDDLRALFAPPPAPATLGGVSGEAPPAQA